MPIATRALREARQRAARPTATTLAEARALNLKTIFLCHSHRDAELVQGFVALLTETGWKAYVDWADVQMPDKPNRVTAIRLQQKIVEHHYFLYLATANSSTSRWCPWEIGYADGKKPLDKIIVCPTTDGITTYGSEYLDLYRRLEVSDFNELAVWQPGDAKSGVRVREL